MAKKKSWFCFLKKLFTSEAKSKAEKKSKCWGWIFERFRPKQYPPLAAPERTLNELIEDQRKHALTVAIATAAAAEAALAAAHAAAEVVRLAGTSQSYHPCDKRDQNLAVIKIQSVFRGHLARKAFRALKGLVRLQAIVRGRIVRRQSINKLRSSPLTSNVQSRVPEIRVPTEDECCNDGGKQQFVATQKELGKREIKIEYNRQRSWDDSIFSKEDVEATWFRKQEAIIKRERMKKYSFSHRERRNVHMLEESAPSMESGRSSCLLEQWADAKAYGREEMENLKPTVHSITSKHDVMERLNYRHSLPRRSFCHAKQNSFGEDSSCPNSPVCPTYMAATESAKAKARSMSTPKQRPGFLDTCPDHNSPHKNMLSFGSSFNGKSISSKGSSGPSQQTSISMKSLH